MTVDIDTLISCAAIPSLLRKGAPVYDLISEKTLTFVSMRETKPGREQQAIIGPLRGKLVPRKIGFLYLDLNDPIGRQIALDWLRKRRKWPHEEVTPKEIKYAVLELHRLR